MDFMGHPQVYDCNKSLLSNDSVMLNALSPKPVKFLVKRFHWCHRMIDIGLGGWGGDVTGKGWVGGGGDRGFFYGWALYYHWRYQYAVLQLQYVLFFILRDKFLKIYEVSLKILGNGLLHYCLSLLMKCDFIFNHM